MAKQKNTQSVPNLNFKEIVLLLSVPLLMFVILGFVEINYANISGLIALAIFALCIIWPVSIHYVKKVGNGKNK